MMKRIFTALLLLIPLAMLTGCSTTSAPAQFALYKSVPVITGRLVAYGTAATDVASVTAANELSATVAVQSQIDIDQVAAKWPPVKKAYLDYVSKDARYQPVDRLRMGDTVSKIQTLIDTEQQRRASLFNFLSPNPPVVVP